LSFRHNSDGSSCIIGSINIHHSRENKLVHGKSYQQDALTHTQGEEQVTAERAIHAAMFGLLLVGLCALSWWASYHYIQKDDLVLMVASVALSWGIILLALYLIFRKLNWHWWIKSST
jgi:hypothetical protein